MTSQKLKVNRYMILIAIIRISLESLYSNNYCNLVQLISDANSSLGHYEPAIYFDEGQVELRNVYCHRHGSSFMLDHKRPWCRCGERGAIHDSI